MLRLHPMFCWLAATLAVAATLTLTAPARATTFGADLSLPPNGTRTCSQGLYPDPFMAAVVGVDFGSCTWWSAGSLTAGVGDALVPRGGGVLRRVRVKVGPVTGRMQVLVLRQRRHPLAGTAACCFFVASTPVFTPAPNAVTELQTDIPVVNAYDAASGVENFDLIALSSLDRGVPVPSWLGGSGYAGGAIGGVFPHWQPPTEQRPDYGTVTFGQVLIAGDVDPPPPPPPPPTVSVERAAAVTGNRRAATLTVRCGPTAPCQGKVQLMSRVPTTTTRAVEYGRASFTLHTGERARVRVTLASRARRALARRRKLPAYAMVTITGTPRTGSRITLRR